MNDEPTTTEIDPGTAVVTVPRQRAPLEAQSAGVLAIIPTNIDEAQRYASGLIAAGIVPDAFKFTYKEAGKNADIREGDINGPLVLMGVLKAMEIGVAPQTGLAGLLPLNGRFAVWGDLAAGLVQRGGQVENQTKVPVGPSFDPATPLGEWPDEYGYEVRYWRKGQDQPYVGRFTVRDAKRADLWMNARKKPWIMYPDRMLFNRARAFVLRDGFADALMGLSIAEEVMDSLPSVEEETRIEAKRLTALTDDTPEIAQDAPIEIEGAATGGEPDERAGGDPSPPAVEAGGAQIGGAG